MEILYYRHKLQTYLSNRSQKGRKVAFVPTMGALHEGHLSLIKMTQDHADLTISSIFVNPKQFDKKEDLEKYPRQLEQDIKLLDQAGCNAVYIPDPDDIYPLGYTPITLDIADLEKMYEGEKRKGHFDGVVQVLYQFFDIIKPDVVCFGQKDFQQCLVVKTLINQYFKNIEMLTCPTFRNEDGLALSSRNKRLSPNGLLQAAHLNKGLKLAISHLENNTIHKALNIASDYLEKNEILIEYLDIADANNLASYKSWNTTPKNKIIIVAAYIEGIRLIDNMIF